MSSLPHETSEPRVAYSVNDVCRMLGLGRNSVTELIKSGRIRSVKVGARHVIPRSSIDKFLDGEAE